MSSPSVFGQPVITGNAIKLCKSPGFQKFLGVETEADAKAVLCERCRIQTRKQLATSPAAAIKFSELIQRFNTWSNSNG